VSGQLSYLKNVVTLELNQEKCVGCGMCTVVCPQAVMILYDQKAHLDNRDACMECGACAMNCPAEAISVEAGVGCAAAVINTVLGRNSNSCCCIIEDTDSSAGCGID
jgi:NAD-dependent dihydropyrimidine dehydrogenase PreA subunit